MRVVVIGKEFSEYNREVEDFMRDFEARTGVEVERINPETKEGETFCRARDVVQYPTVIVETEEGKILGEYRGTPLPGIDEVFSYLK
ncbi:hypothetical protein IJI70_01705 [Candidatus Saccharibacteria bacterium]|nr:hypothetical protein [Candidatus Saccharibacteria bacterium]